MKSAGKARNNGLYRHIRTSKEIIRNLLNDYTKNTKFRMSNLARKKLHLQIHSFFKRIFCLQTQPFYNLPR